MWVLESDGDVLKGMQSTIPPRRPPADMYQARSYGFDRARTFFLGALHQKACLPAAGRTLYRCTDLAVGQFVVTDKTISRKHLTIEVEKVPAADCVRGSNKQHSHGLMFTGQGQLTIARNPTRSEHKDRHIVEWRADSGQEGRAGPGSE